MLKSAVILRNLNTRYRKLQKPLRSQYTLLFAEIVQPIYP